MALLASDGRYCAFATASVDSGAELRVQVSRSNDHVNWTKPEEAMPDPPTWAAKRNNYWAPKRRRIVR